MLPGMLRALLIAAISVAYNGIKQSIDLYRKSWAQICWESFNKSTQKRKFALERVASLIIVWLPLYSFFLLKFCKALGPTVLN